MSARIMEVAHNANRCHPNDIAAARQLCLSELKKFHDYEERVVPELIEIAVKEMIYDSRHRDNERCTRGNGANGSQTGHLQKPAPDDGKETVEPKPPKPKSQPNPEDYGRSAGGDARFAALAAIHTEQLMDTYKIGRRTIGTIYGYELTIIEAEERALALGHTFRENLVKELKPLVPDSKQVKEAVSSERFATLFHSVHKRTMRKRKKPKAAEG